MTRDSENERKAKKPGGRGQRLAAALRENLRRRKAQERQRGAEPGPGARSEPAPAPRDDKNR
jgi:hypothetical protein